MGGDRALVLGADPTCSALTAGLATAGWIATAIVEPATDLSTEAKLRSAIEHTLGDDDVALIVSCIVAERALQPTPLVELTDAEWSRMVDGTLDAARWLSKAVSSRLRRSEGTLLYVVPSLALVGGAGFVPLTCAAEGVRGWAKSLAKQWAVHGVRVQTLALALVHFSAGEPGAPEQRATLTGPAFGSVGVLDDGISSIVSALGRPDLRFLTGATLVVDGGLFMGH